MTIYVGPDFRCHTINPGGYREVETDFFDGKCSAFIEGYRFVPKGETWESPDGVVIVGESIFPANDYKMLESNQKSYEEGTRQYGYMISEIDAAYREGVNSV